MNLELGTKSKTHCRSGQVWLPNAQVWARIPVKPVVKERQGFTASVRRTDRPVSTTSVNGAPCSMQELGASLQGQQRDGSSQEHAPGAASAEEPSARASYTFFDLAEQPLDLPQPPLSEVDLISDEDSEGGLPVCPICLGEIFDLRDKAVVISCMHVFCLACLSRWSSLKKSCPLCKSRIQGYMYNILSETNYQERILPATPPRAKTPPSPGPTAERQRALPLIDARPSSSRGDARGERPRASSRPGDRAPAFRRGSRDLAGEFVPGRWPPVRAARRTETAASSRQAPLKEPRPYFYRVQAQAQSQVQGGPLAGRGGLRTSEGVASLEDAAEAWRRHIYVQGLRASPMDGDAAAGHPSMSEERRDARLSAWVDRELRALLQTDDVAIVRAYVMGLVRGIGFPRPSGGDGPPAHGIGPPPDNNNSGRGGEHRDAVAALRPFLQEHAGHFWHELRCFAAVPLSMQTYDRLVQYHTRPPAAASSPVTVPSTESSSAAVNGAPFHHSRVGGSADRSPMRREGAAVDRGRDHHSNTPERSRKRRRFSSHPPEDTESEMTASRRESDRRRGYMHRQEAHDDGFGAREERRGHRRDDSAARSGHRERACHERPGRADSRTERSQTRSGRDAQSREERHERRRRADGSREGARGKVQRPHGVCRSSTEPAGAGSSDRGEDVLADLRARALAALQARKQAAEQG
ncbi:probable E3 ubiquitin-protein ligase IE61 at N-terminal half [Coccomyxa sp. Obi]|nr:probable E3 ubiquitin-protein ligase IE61 at N-terminal half [Coccomyxa sp. Obi]